jgi:Tfp pilus assembly PilM family ATPase
MLFGGKKSKQLVGLDIGSSSIKSVELKNTKAGYELVSFGMESLAPDTVVDGAIMDAPQVANAISRIFDSAGVKTKNVATSVSGHSVIVKRVPLPLMSEEELYDRIPAEASQHMMRIEGIHRYRFCTRSKNVAPCFSAVRALADSRTVVCRQIDDRRIVGIHGNLSAKVSRQPLVRLAPQ